MQQTRIIIAGGRDFSDFDLLDKETSSFIASNIHGEVEIVSGGAAGADSLGEMYADKFGYKVKRFPADWKTHGKAAGPIRNEQMAKYASHCIVFWDCESRGTKNMIDQAKRNSLNLKVVIYSNHPSK